MNLQYSVRLAISKLVLPRFSFTQETIHYYQSWMMLDLTHGIVILDTARVLGNKVSYNIPKFWISTSLTFMLSKYCVQLNFLLSTSSKTDKQVKVWWPMEYDCYIFSKYLAFQMKNLVFQSKYLVFRIINFE